MTESFLKIFLPAFMLVVIWVTVFWNFSRKAIKTKTSCRDLLKYNRLKRINKIYWLILLFLAVMVIIYSGIPDLYFIFIPLEMFNIPIINLLGIIILLAAIVWIIFAQLEIDKELYKYSRNIESLSAMELVHYSEKKFLSGILILFIGVFVTITNLVAIVLSMAAIIFYVATFRHK